MTLRTQLAYAAAVLTLVVGLLALLNPVLAARLLGLEVVAPRGLSELRSGYGALTLALAGLMLWALPLRPKTAALLRTLAIVVGAAALGRLASMAIDGVFGLMNLLFLVLQSAVALSLVWASSERPPTKRERLAQREAADARDAAASARVAALDAQRRAGAGGAGDSARRDPSESNRP